MSSNSQHVSSVHSEHDVDDIEVDSDGPEDQKDLETEDLDDIRATLAGPYIPNIEALGIIDDEIEQEPAADVMSNQEFARQSILFRRSQQYDRRRDNIRLTLNSAELLRSSSGVSSLVLPEEFGNNETDSPRELISHTNAGTAVANPLANPSFIHYLEDEDDSGTDHNVDSNEDSSMAHNEANAEQSNHETSRNDQEAVNDTTSGTDTMDTNPNDNNGDDHDSDSGDLNHQVPIFRLHRGHRNPQVPIILAARGNATETTSNLNESSS